MKNGRERKMKQIVMKKVSDLIAYDNNPRNNDDAVDSVANSIHEFGFKVPIVIDANNIIVAGHTRLKASKKLGLDEVPCIVADDLSEDQIKAFRLADNKSAEFAKWDTKKLEEELKNIDIDMTSFGFENIDDVLPKEVEDDDFDEGQYLSDEPYSLQGDIYLLGKHRLMCGDSTNAENVKTLLDGQLVDMIFTDPPYNVNYEGSVGKIQNDNMDNNAFFTFLTGAFDNMFSGIREGGAIYVCHADTEGVNFRTAFANAGFKLAECLIWSKDQFVFGRQDYHWRHEPILYGWKEGSSHYFINDHTQDTIWEFPRPKHNELHPTMKPLELVGRAINNSSKAGWKILDLFGGSGSTLIASEQAGRQAFSMELDEKYVDVIVKRFGKLTGNYNNCFLIRNGVKTPLIDIPDLLIDFSSINKKQAEKSDVKVEEGVEEA